MVTQFELTNHIIRNVNSMKPHTKLLLLAIVSFGGDNNNWRCWPSQKTLAKMMNLSPQRVIPHVQILRKLGYISTEQRYDNSLIYTINISTLISEMIVPHIENDSRVVSEMIVPHIENDILTNQEQTIEQTNEQITLKEEEDKILMNQNELTRSESEPIEILMNQNDSTDVQNDSTDVQNDSGNNSNLTVNLSVKEEEEEDKVVIENDCPCPSTVSDLPTVSSLTVVEFKSSSDAYDYVRSMGSGISEKEFKFKFGSTGRYEEPELQISIKRVY